MYAFYKIGIQGRVWCKFFYNYVSFSAEAVSQFFCCCDAHLNSGVPNLEEGLPRWLSGKRIHLPMQEIWV